jgi:hypothetical protein
MLFRGAIFETMIVGEFFKSIANRCSRERLYYYRDSNRNEIDIVLQNGKDTLLCEIKSGATLYAVLFSHRGGVECLALYRGGVSGSVRRLIRRLAVCYNYAIKLRKGSDSHEH